MSSSHFDVVGCTTQRTRLQEETVGAPIHTFLRTLYGGTAFGDPTAIERTVGIRNPVDLVVALPADVTIEQATRSLCGTLRGAMGRR
jgi:hypothetical protein